MYAPRLLYRYHGIIKTPMIAVIIPPMRNEMRFGSRFEMSFAGLTTFAAIFVVSVATESMTSEMMITGTEPSFATTLTGSQIVSWKMIVVALVTMIPMKQKSVIVVGSP